MAGLAASLVVALVLVGGVDVVFLDALEPLVILVVLGALPFVPYALMVRTHVGLASMPLAATKAPSGENANQ